jgi:D-glycero-D-manno-heptose 1,7-bisphosphate phosphatase
MHHCLMSRFPLEGVLLCPHDEADRCPCRKPKPGLLIEAAFKWHLDLDHSFVVGERWQDAEAARVAGCTSLLLRSPWNGPVHHDCILDSLPEITDKILRLAANHHPPVAGPILAHDLTSGAGNR